MSDGDSTVTPCCIARHGPAVRFQAAAVLPFESRRLAEQPASVFDQADLCRAQITTIVTGCAVAADQRFRSTSRL